MSGPRLKENPGKSHRLLTTGNPVPLYQRKWGFFLAFFFFLGGGGGGVWGTGFFVNSPDGGGGGAPGF
jgi:hypothetical protein